MANLVVWHHRDGDVEAADRVYACHLTVASRAAAVVRGDLTRRQVLQDATAISNGSGVSNRSGVDHRGRRIARLAADPGAGASAGEVIASDASVDDRQRDGWGENKADAHGVLLLLL